MRRRFLLLMPALPLACVSGLPLLVRASYAKAAEKPPARVISLGGSVTEIIYALGMGPLLVGNDLSSVYPEEATRLPRVGYYRALSLEGLVSLQPDLIIASENAGPPQVLERVRLLGIPLVTVSDAPGLESLYTRIGQIAEAVGAAARGTKLAQRLRAEMHDLQDDIARAKTEGGTRRAIVLMRGSAQYQLAGADTTAAAVLALSGLDNIASAQSGYKPVSAEGLAALNPDLIVITSRSAHAAGGINALLADPGIAATRAGQEKRVIVMDDLLILGMGPRTPQAVRELALRVRQSDGATSKE